MSLQLFPKNKETLGASNGPAQLRGECEEGCDHTDKWKSCVQKVGKKSIGNAYAICTAQTESSRIQFKGSIQESNSVEGEPMGRRFRVTLIKEGLGNLGDCFYYMPSAIQSGVQVFEGKKFFLNHPSNSEEADRPERSVKDVSGYYENCRAEQEQDGRFKLTADLVMPLDDSFNRERALMLESIAYSQKHQDQDLIGLSINADGNSYSIGLEQFMRENSIPDSCKEKLLEALARGITTIHPVQELTSAVSCDLVTQAGAGGRIDQLLEQEKTEMKAKAKEAKEASKKEDMEAKKEGAPADQLGADGKAADPAPKEDDGAEDQDANGQDGEHDDADQDQELILKMLDKYLGSPQHDEESVAAAKEAYQNALEACGGDQGKAMEMAGNVVAMHKHLQNKEKGNPAGVEPVAPDPQDQKESAPKPPVQESSKGSNRLIALTAENARLKAEIESLKLEKFIEKTLKESKLPMSATKPFRECIKDAKTEKEVTEKFNVFKEAFKLGGEADGMGFIINAEKETPSGAKGGLDLSDCVEN